MNEDIDSINRMRAVTIAREYGSGGGEIATRLAKRLRWQLVDHAMVERVAREIGTSQEEAEVHDEHIQGMVSRTLGSLLYLEDSDRHPEASIKGDLGIIVTEQEVARGPITGRYTVETQDMREPLFVRWHAQHGRVLNRAARSTAIAFDLCGTRAGQIWTAVITVQVTDAETCDTIIKGTFVQIRVMDA